MRSVAKESTIAQGRHELYGLPGRLCACAVYQALLLATPARTLTSQVVSLIDDARWDRLVPDARCQERDAFNSVEDDSGPVAETASARRCATSQGGFPCMGRATAADVPPVSGPIHAAKREFYAGSSLECGGALR